LKIFKKKLFEGSCRAFTKYFLILYSDTSNKNPKLEKTFISNEIKNLEQKLILSQLKKPNKEA
jgi:hypothetical protein